MFSPKWAEDRVITPAPRPSEGQGMHFSRGGLVPFVSGLLTASFGSQRVTGTHGAFLSGEGALYLPPQALSHAHFFVFPAPGFFFFFLALGAPNGVPNAIVYYVFNQLAPGPRMECQTLLCTMQNSERCSENTPELSVNTRKHMPSSTPPPLLRLCRF